MKNVLITGVAGFIGMHLAKVLSAQNFNVTGLDNFDRRKTTSLTFQRWTQLQQDASITLHHLDLRKSEEVNRLFESSHFDGVVHLAAKTGVRESLKQPRDYLDTNMISLVNLLEACRLHGLPRFVFASSSSVYGNSPYAKDQQKRTTDQPLSVYAASKKGAEILTHTYEHLYGMDCTGLRLFTVYGPWVRPDMAISSFTHKILAGETIHLYGRGSFYRDFTYIDDIIQAFYSALLCPSPATRENKLIDVGYGQPISLFRLIDILEKSLNTKAKLHLVQGPKTEVNRTCADIGVAKTLWGYNPKIGVEVGIDRFVQWYQTYHQNDPHLTTPACPSFTPTSKAKITSVITPKVIK